MKKLIALLLTASLFAYENTLSIWEIFPSSYTQNEIDIIISSASALTAGLPQPAQLANYTADNGKAILSGDIKIDEAITVSDKNKFWCHYGFDKHGYIRDENFAIMQDAFFYLHTSTYSVEVSTP